MTNTERSKAVYPLHSCIVIRKSTENGYPYSRALHNRCYYVSSIKTSKTYPSTSYFFMFGVYTVSTYFTTQKQYWWDANSETIHGQLLHLFSIQECWIIEEKWRFVKSIRHLKRSNIKVGWRCPSYKKSIQVVSQHGIKGRDTMDNLVWVNTHISGYVMHNSIGIVICST